MNPKRNTICDENPDGCWTCECGKHHNCKDGAEKCCTKEVSKLCNCRHCSKLNSRATEELVSIPPNPKGIGYP